MPKLIADHPTLRVPQARVLKALLPKDATDHYTEWPSMSVQLLATTIGVSQVSDCIRRALKGLQVGSTSGTPHKGLLDMGYVRKIYLDIDGVTEIYYSITASGIRELTKYLACKKLPKQRDPKLCVNDRYK